MAMHTPAVLSPDKQVHVCSECFEPRSRYAETFYCAQCERRLFRPSGSVVFLHAEATRQGMRRHG